MDTFYSDINIILEQSSNRNQEDLNRIKRVKGQLELMKKYTDTTNHYKEKVLLLTSFVKYVEMYCMTKVKIYGSFIRQMFEKVFLDSYDNSGYGDSENHDIDMTIFPDETTYIIRKEMFNNMIKNLEILSNLEDIGINFEGFSLIKVQDLTIIQDEERIISRFSSMYPNEVQVEPEELEETPNINKYLNNPHYHLIFKKNNKFVVIELFAYTLDTSGIKYDINSDLDVNKLTLTSDGIKSEYNFLSTICSIIKKHVITKAKVDNLVKDLKEQTLTFSEKKYLYNQLLQFIVYRTKVLGVGYNKITSDFGLCDIEIETQNICELTESNPPYIKVNLECGHSMSVMAMAGITNIQVSEYTQMIACPFCREKLIPKLKKEKVLEIDSPEREIMDSIYYENCNKNLNENIEIPYYQHNEIMSKENFLQVSQVIGIKVKNKSEIDEINQLVFSLDTNINNSRYINIEPEIYNDDYDDMPPLIEVSEIL